MAPVGRPTGPLQSPYRGATAAHPRPRQPRCNGLTSFDEGRGKKDHTVWLGLTARVGRGCPLATLVLSLSSPAWLRGHTPLLAHTHRESLAFASRLAA
jgi:hypothetical protein